MIVVLMNSLSRAHRLRRRRDSSILATAKTSPKLGFCASNPRIPASSPSRCVVASLARSDLNAEMTAQTP